MKKMSSVRRLAFSALVAAVYAALTMALGFMSYNGIQFRVAEALCVLPFFFPCTTWGLFIGCLIANIISPAGILDVVFGSLATLLCCLFAAALGRKGDYSSPLRRFLVCLGPVLSNAVIVGTVLAFTIADPGMGFGAAFALFGAQVALGEAVIMFTLGLLLLRSLPKMKLFQMLKEKLN